MRQFLAVAVLGMSLAFTANAAFASEKVDYKPAFQPAQNAAIVNRAESLQSVLAGAAAPLSVWREMREDNFGR